jgi:hypothetical protein
MTRLAVAALDLAGLLKLLIGAAVSIGVVP